MDNKVLVTGATGFVGSQLIKKLRQQNTSVFGISQSGGKIQDVIVDPIDLTRYELLKQWKRDKEFAAVIHLAAEVPASSKEPIQTDLLYRNFISTLNTARLAINSKAYLVFMSSSSVYGIKTFSGKRNRSIDESVIPFPNNWYSFSKYLGELICSYCGRNKKLAYSALRLSSPYGPGNKRNTVINCFMRNALASKNLHIYGTGSRTQDFIHIDDVVDAIIQAIQNSLYGVYNLSSGNSVSMVQLANLSIQCVPGTESKIVYTGLPDKQENYRGNFLVQRIHDRMGWSAKMNLSDGLRVTGQWLQKEFDACC